MILFFISIILFTENQKIHSEVRTEIDLQSRQTIPVLDLNDYKYGDEASKSKFIQEVAYALHEYGFFALENSDVDEKILKNGFNSAVSFFDHDHSYKLLYQNKYPNRGYKSFNLDVPPDAYQNLTWKAAHKDPNLITFIYGITSAGLEIQRPDGSWLKVEYIPGQVIVSGSNMLENLSNGLFKSTPHRVMTYRNHSRYAIPFFYHVRRELDISPTEKAIERTGGKALYPSMTAQKALEGHHWFGGKAQEKPN